MILHTEHLEAQNLGYNNIGRFTYDWNTARMMNN